jgi:xanthine dehydrogenase YagR molybdenum-binding subunit
LIRNARFVNDNLADHSIPVNAETPSVRGFWQRKNRREPRWCEGLGEPANVGTAAVGCNAVCHATGIRVRKLPIRIEDVLEG